MEFQYKGKFFCIDGAAENDRIYRVIRESNSFYEIDLLEYSHHIMKSFNPSNSLAIDVGANIGNHSIYFQSFLASYIIAVEPNSEILPILKRNLSRNIKNYTIHEKGLGEFFGKGSIVYPPGSENNIGMAKIELSGGNIDIVTLDSLIENWQDINGVEAIISLIKVDVEGMELSVLKGAKDTISRHRPHLLLEAATPSNFLELKHYLEPLGYLPLGHYAYTPVYHFSPL
jgi:protein O-GlcNAc transferase